VEDIKTSQALLDRLRAAAHRQAAPADVEKQMVSYIMGFVKDTSNVTESRIREVLARQKGLTPD